MSTAYEIPLSDFIKRMASLGGDVEAAVIRGLQSAAMRLDGFVVHEIDNSSPHPAVDRGELRNSRETKLTERGAQYAITAPHAIYMEQGTRPHRPPYQPIYEWLVRKGLVDESEAAARAWQIVNAIAERGIAPRHYLKKAWERLIQGRYVGREVGRELEALAKAREKGRVGNARRGSGPRS